MVRTVSCGVMVTTWLAVACYCTPAGIAAYIVARRAGTRLRAARPATCTCFRLRRGRLRPQPDNTYTGTEGWWRGGFQVKVHLYLTVVGVGVGRSACEFRSATARLAVR
eukprot:1638198-Prymnesium_polylepis.1